MSTATEAMKRNSLGIGLIAGIAAAIALTFAFVLHVPIGNVLQFSFPATTAGITAVALVLMYRTSRIINFAQLALGALSAQLFYYLYTDTHLPFGIALAIGLIAGIILATVIGVIASTLFFKHPRLVMTVVSILFVQLITYVQGRLQGIFVKPGEIQPPADIPGPWPDTSFELSTIPFRPIHGIGIGMMILVLVGLVVFFRRTRTGIAIRASAENADRAALLGINVKLLNVGVWSIVGFMASVSQVGLMPITGYNQSAILEQTALLLPLAAAVVARLANMPIAFIAAFGFVMLDRGLEFGLANSSFVQLVLVGILLLSLLVQRRKLNVRADEATSWKAMKEFRPIPRELLGVSGVRRTRWALLAVFALIVLGLPWIVSTNTVITLQIVWLAGMVALSLVILTGWSGQMSLGQFAFVGAGSYVTGYFALKGLPFLPGLFIGGLAGAAFALLVGLPALRIRGLYLAVSTFAIAIIAPLLFFGDDYLGTWAPLNDVARPQFLFLDFSDEKSMYYLLMVFFVLAVGSVTALRNSRAGRTLIAMRDNEDGVRAFGVNVVRTRLVAFALSGFMAGFGGGLLIHQQLGMTQGLYTVGFSINIFVLTVIGGISSAVGAFLGAAYFIFGTLVFPGLADLVNGILGLVVMMFIPGGLSQVFFGARDAVLRVVAMRQHIVVPSLFADYSPEAWEKRLAPLSQSVQNHGIGALRHDQRYRMPSKVFGRAQA